MLERLKNSLLLLAPTPEVTPPPSFTPMDRVLLVRESWLWGDTVDQGVVYMSPHDNVPVPERWREYGRDQYVVEVKHGCRHSEMVSVCPDSFIENTFTARPRKMVPSSYKSPGRKGLFRRFIR